MADPVAAYIMGKQLEAQRAEQQRQAEEDRRRRAEEDARRKEEEQKRAAESAQAKQQRVEELSRQAKEAEEQAKGAREMAEGKNIPPVGPAGAWMLDPSYGVMPSTEELKREETSARGRAEQVRRQIETERRMQEIETHKDKYDFTTYAYTDKAGTKHQGEEAWEAQKADIASDTEKLKALTSKELAPFVHFNKDGSYSIDLDAATKAGKKDLLIKAGVSRGTIWLAEKRIKEGKERKYVPPEEAKRITAAGEFTVQQFKKNHTELPDGQWMANYQLKAIKQQSPELYGILTTKGVDAANTYIDDYNRHAMEQLENYEQGVWALAMLDQYQLKNDKGDPTGEYDLVRIMSSGNERVIKAAGVAFTAEQLKDTQKYLDAIRYARVEPEIVFIADKGSKFAKRIMDEIAGDPELNWVRAQQKLQREMDSGTYKKEFKEYISLMTRYDKQIRKMQRDQLVAVIKSTPDRLADMFVPFKATVQHWDELSTVERSAALAGDIGLTILYAIGIGQAVGLVKQASIPGTAISRAEKAAQTAGKAQKELKAAEAALQDAVNIPYGPSVYKSAAVRKMVNTVSQLREASITADKAFLGRLGKVRSLNNAELRYLEKMSGMKGLKTAMVNANNAAVKLEKAWAKIPENITTDRPVAKGYYFEFDTRGDLYRRYQELYKAQEAYSKAMKELDNVLKVRFTEGPPPDTFAGWELKVKIPPKPKPSDDLFKDIDDWLGAGSRTRVATKQRTGVTIGEWELKPAYKKAAAPKAKTTPVTKVKVGAKPDVKLALATKGKAKAEPEIDRIPREALGKMTPEQIARIYGQEEAISYRAKRIGETGFMASELTMPQLISKNVPTGKQKTASVVDIRMAVEPEPRIAPQAQVKPQVKTRVKTQVKTQPKPKIKPHTPKPGTPTPLVPFGFGGMSDKQNRQLIKKAKLSVGWRQGELRGQDRYDVIVDPFTPKEKYLIVLGNRPQGLTSYAEGPGSAYKTSQILTGRLKQSGVVDNPGIFSTQLWPESKKKLGLRFVHDDEANQPISEPPPRITARERRVSPKPPRITPPMPRLR